MAERTALIVGAGIGGLALAIKLREAGLRARVFEAADDLRKVQIGGGLFLWNNGMRALQRLGLEDQVRAVCSTKVREFVLRTWRDEPLVSWPVGEVEGEVGAPAGGIARYDLHRILSTAVPGDAIRFGARCTGFTQDTDGVTARFADGSTERGDVLIGADGVKSHIRAQFAGGVRPRYTGYTLWQAIIDYDDRVTATGVFLEYWGKGARFGFYPTGPRQLNWSAVCNAPEGQADPPTGVRERLLADFRGWPPLVGAALAATPAGAIRRRDIYGCAPLPAWGEGRVTLLGDAAHPMTFNLGQGACQSLEDAVVLARHLAGTSEPAAALRAYEAERRDRAARIMKRAESIGSTGRWTNPLAVKVRDTTMRTMSRNGLRNHRRDMAFAF